jgi:hypothetical protein
VIVSVATRALSQGNGKNCAILNDESDKLSAPGSWVGLEHSELLAHVLHAMNKPFATLRALDVV